MAELRQNTWTLGQWYDQDVAGNVSYTNQGTLWVWGYNQVGELGRNNNVYLSSPTQLGSASTWRELEFGTGSSSSCWGVINSSKELWMVGAAEHGQLGQNTSGPSAQYISSPVQVAGTTWSKVVTGGNMTISVKTDGTLWTWGYNDGGILGQNQAAAQARSSPIQVGSGTDWSNETGKIAVGGACAGAIKTDGTLWIWGANTYGMLGQNTTTSYSSPRQLTGTTWNTISFAQNGSFGVKTDGTFWSWGLNSYGMLGLNDDARRSSPTQVGTDTTWSGIVPFGGWYAMATIKTDGTMWAWGGGDMGSLAQNNLTHYSSPVQIPGTTWSKVVKGNDGTSQGLKTDGTLWTWGTNAAGKLGLNTPNNSNLSSPVQVPGSWADIFQSSCTVGIKNT
jgi:alpha-tubulin suppressor-like RCC1 family protein